MLSLWKENPNISFAFYAVPRKKPRKSADVRFNIYESAMLNLFSPDHFRHYEDPKSFIYVLLNQKSGFKKTRLREMGKYLLSEYETVFEPVERRGRPSISFG